MGWINRSAVQAIMLALVLCGSGSAALAQPASDRIAAPAAPEEAVFERPEEFSSDDFEEAQRAFDILARSFSKKKRSELINLKTYTDAEWAQLEAGVKADNAACRKGDAEACLAAGRAYENGDGVWLVPAIAFILYREACDGGQGEGCRAFHDLANSGWGYPEGGIAAADGMLEKGCEKGDLVSCEMFAVQLRETDEARSDAVLDTACAAGGLEACMTYGSYLLGSAVPEDAARGRGILAASCDRGVSAACMTLATRGGQDPAEAVRYLKLACEGGDSEACSQIGQRAWTGTGIPEDHQQAIAYYAKACAIDDYLCAIPASLTSLPATRAACEDGAAEACADLGRALLVPGSPAFDEPHGAELLAAACLGGTSTACADAAAAVGTLGDNERAGELLETGCRADDPRSCMDLAGWLQTLPDRAGLDRAVALYQRLCDSGGNKACEAEARFAGVVAAARIPPADGTYQPPLPTDGASGFQRPLNLPQICLTGSERFRGKTYSYQTCERREQGMNSDIARYGQAPWQALLWRPAAMLGRELVGTERVLCGGSLIAQGWVLTAAHCTLDNGTDLARDPASSGYLIRLGVFYSTRDEGIGYPIRRVIRHPRYDPANRYAFDIALIEYDTSRGRPGSEGGFRNPVRTIALDPRDADTYQFPVGVPVYAFGWGWQKVVEGSATDHLQIMKMTVRREAACTLAADSTGDFRNSALCALGPNLEQACTGDSGGPLVYYDKDSRPVLVGIVSSGHLCGTKRNASKYTRVAKVRDWIAAYVPAAVK